MLKHIKNNDLVLAAIGYSGLGLCLILMVAMLTGCGTAPAFGPTVAVPGPVVTVTPDPVADTIEQQIARVVAEENTYRDGLGQTFLTPGLTCILYSITGGQYLQSGGGYSPTLTGISQKATFKYKGEFNQADSPASDGLNVLPLGLRSQYTNMYKLTCYGNIVVVETGYHQFDLSSDDGSVLYIGGTRLIDNDGQHGVVTKSATSYLRKGVYSFKLDFAQSGGGSQALILNQDGNLLDGMFLYH